MKIAVSSDHAGYERKQSILKYLKEQGIEFKDFGAYSSESSDYPDFAHPIAVALSNGEFDFGITLCGSANGKSAIYKTNLSTGKVLQTKKLADQYFGEGITILKNRIFQLTYKTKIAFVYNLENLTTIDSFHFESKEGWGLTNDDKYLIMSDGTNLLTFIDPNSYKTVKKIQVYNNKEAVLYLNELEYSDGFIYANVWSTNFIVKIDPQTGKVLQKIDLDGILSMTNTSKQVDVLNGIAIEPQSKKFCVTGKYYPAIFEIKLIKKE